MSERLVSNVKGVSTLKVTIQDSNSEDIALMMIDKLSLPILEVKVIAQRVFPKLDIHLVMMRCGRELCSGKFDRAVAYLEKNHNWEAEPNLAITFDDNGEYLCWAFEI